MFGAGNKRKKGKGGKNAHAKGPSPEEAVVMKAQKKKAAFVADTATAAAEVDKYARGFWEDRVRSAVDSGESAHVDALVKELTKAWGPPSAQQWPQWWFRMEDKYSAIVEPSGSDAGGATRTPEQVKAYGLDAAPAASKAAAPKAAAAPKIATAPKAAPADADKIAVLKAEGEVRLNLRAEMAANYEGKKKILDLTAEGEARIAARAQSAQQQRVYELTRDGEDTIAKREAVQTQYKSAKKVQDLTAEGEARIAARAEAAEKLKVYQLTREGEATIAKRAALKAQYESVKKVQELTAEGRARIAMREEVLKQKRVYELTREGEARIAKRAEVQAAYLQAVGKGSSSARRALVGNVDNTDGRGGLRSLLLGSRYSPRV